MKNNVGHIRYNILPSNPVTVGAGLDHSGNRAKSVQAKDVRLDGYTPGHWPSFVNAGEGDPDFEKAVNAADQSEIEWIYRNGGTEE